MKIKLLYGFYWMIFICIYMIPVYFFESIDLEVDKYIYALVLILCYAITVVKECKVEFSEFLFIIFIFFVVFIKKELSYFHLIGLPFGLKILKERKYTADLKTFLTNSNVIYLSLAFVFLYSFLYFGYEGRYIFTGMKEPNLSGFSLFILFTIIRVRNKELGNILLLLGVFSFSKSYLLAILLYFIIPRFKIKKLNIIKFSMGFIIILVLLSNLFVFVEKKGSLKDYQSGISRYFVLFDYSNYYRFTVNTNLIKVFNNNLNLLLVGMENEDFFKYNYQVTKENNTKYFQIKPHNYIFSYLQRYGIWSIIIFIYTYRIFKQVLSEKNNKIAIPIFFYLMFLGIGATSYWMYLSIFALLASEEEINRYHYEIIE